MNSQKSKTKNPTFISLFSGCGGFDLGFVKSGYKSLGGFDIDALALDNLHKNIGSPVYQCDLSKEELPISFENSPDVVLSGSPCQGFSTIGKRDLNDPRNNLLLSGAKIALKLNPKVFVAENVPGVISGAHKKYWEILKTMMAEAGYKTREMKIDAHDFGVPQKRKRMVLFAWKSGDFFEKLPAIKNISLEDAFANIDGLNNHQIEPLDKNSNEYKISLHIKQGQKLSNVRGGERSVHTWDIPEVFGQVTKKERGFLTEIISLRRRLRERDFGDADPVRYSMLESTFGTQVIESLLKKGYLKRIGDCIDLADRFNGKFRRLSFGQPSYTVDTRFGLANNFLHPSQNRAITVREAARIQGFPDDYTFTGPKQNQYKMVGNAVPPPMSYALGKAIKDSLLGVSKQ